MTKIITERLLLRPVKLDDAQAIFNYRSDAQVNQFQGWIPKTFDDVNDFITNKVASTLDVVDSWFQLVVINTELDKIIGDVGIHFFDSDKYQVEIGCTLDKQYHGKGYATEALAGTVDFLFNELNKRRIVTSIDPRNIKSIELMQRLGFRKEAHFIESILIDGVWVDDIVYAVLKDEWMERK